MSNERPWAVQVQMTQEGELRQVTVGRQCRGPAEQFSLLRVPVEPEPVAPDQLGLSEEVGA